jgi:dTDP-4-amino-4,6-dideoxygalactose transaminase
MNWAIPPILKDASRSSCYHLYALRIKAITEKQRDLMIDEITAAGISVNVHFLPLPMLTAFKSMGYSIDNYPKAYEMYANEISLPIYPQLTNDQVDLICKTVTEAYSKIVLNA